MVLYSKFTDGFQFSGEKTVCKSVKWFTGYSNSRDTGEFMRFFETPCIKCINMFSLKSCQFDIKYTLAFIFGLNYSKDLCMSH